MYRLALLAAAVGVLSLPGCVHDWCESWSARRVLDPDEPSASVTAAARVDQVGRQLVAANPFLGIDPTFQTLGSKEPALFHRDDAGVFVTEGLVERCKDDKQLAAVLSTELGRMAAEKRVGRRLGVPDPIPGDTFAGNSEANGIPADQVRLAEVGFLEMKKDAARDRRGPPEDARQIAADILKSAGYDPKDLDDADPLVRSAARGVGLFRGVSAPGSAPKWSPR